ncbi:MAG TPA: hypothetical protein VGI66_03625 [Streptosporangiaceae bacterium]|jgi:hypothetical protein
MEGTLSTRLAEFRHQAGWPETLHGQVEVDQIYAHYQHEHVEFRHPRGGRAMYLQGPLFEHYRGYLQEIAGGVLKDGGREGMKRSMEHLSDQVELNAPREFLDLSRSGHPTVSVGQRVVYDRRPKQHRLSEWELKAKSRIRYMKLPDRLKGWIWWHLQGHTEPPPRRGIHR